MNCNACLDSINGLTNTCLEGIIINNKSLLGKGKYMNIKIDNYMCPNCFIPKAFNPQRHEMSYKCPKCGVEMEYWCSEEIDSETGKSIQNLNIEEDIDIKKIVTGEPTVTCPYCKSINTKRIAATAKAVDIAMFGIFGNKRRYQWHCNNCNSDF